MKEREAFLDKMRVAATCAVVLLHTISGVADYTDMGAYPVAGRVFLTVRDLICWCVPVFLMISGYLFLKPGRKIGFGTMIVKYCRRIVLALLLFGVPYAWLELVAVEGGYRPGMVREAFLRVVRRESWAHMWYLYLILALYLATPALKWALERLPRWSVYVSVLALFAGCSVSAYLYRLTGREEIPRLPDNAIYLFYYICGYLFATGRRENLTRAVDRKVLPLCTVLLFLCMGASRLSGRYDLHMAYNYPFTVLQSLLLFAWAAGREEGRPQAGQSRRNRFWEQASALSFGVYLVHPVFLNIAYKFFHITPLSFPIGLSLPAFFSAALLLAAAAAWTLRKIPALRKYVL